MADEVVEVDESTGEAKLVAEPAGKLAKALSPELEKRKKERMARLAEIEDELLDDSAIILKYANRFADIEPGTREPPQAWIDEMGLEQAQKCLRVANSAWLGAKESPMGLKLASTTVASVLKSKASRDHKEAPRFNVAVVQLPAPVITEFPRLKVEK